MNNNKEPAGFVPASDFLKEGFKNENVQKQNQNVQ